MFYLNKQGLCTVLLIISIWLEVNSADKAKVASPVERENYEEPAKKQTEIMTLESYEPQLPEGMTLDDVLDRAEKSPPADYPPAMEPGMLFNFTLIEQLEYRFDDNENSDNFGWQAQGWVGYDLDKFWWKTSGEAVLDRSQEGESETDFLYSRLISPFWNFQIGVQYANEWVRGDYNDRWSGVVALQGLVPGKFELDTSVYISEDADVTMEVEVEYDLRITQRLVLQPRSTLSFSAQDVPERDLGSGMNGVDLDLRLRYEITRQIAPYIGFRYSLLTGETSSIAENNGSSSELFYLLAGIRVMF